MAFVIILMSLGSVSIMSTTTNIRTWGLFYLAPLIALAFDFCILAESFVIGRVGLFIRESPETPAEEKLWERSKSKQSTELPIMGSVVISILVLIGAMVALWKCDRVDKSYWIWAGGAGGMLAALWLYKCWNCQRLKEFRESVNRERPDRTHSEKG
ncbi:MAG: hypothetical protein JSU70_06695 [Phycisphaerales bacterium]|nr:MAG: hypothetical protein JSU70_06695 [Phycisphaerales bacterium]